jgi:hypothetical protein
MERIVEHASDDHNFPAHGCFSVIEALVGLAVAIIENHMFG